MTDDDPDDRVDAYMAARDAGIDPDDVLSNDPPEQELQEAGVIEPGQPDRPDHSEVLEEQTKLLREIAAAVGADGGN